MHASNFQTLSFRNWWIFRWLFHKRITSFSFFFIPTSFLPVSLTSLHSPQRLPNLHFTAWFHFISKAKPSPSVFFSLTHSIPSCSNFCLFAGGASRPLIQSCPPSADLWPFLHPPCPSLHLHMYWEQKKRDEEPLGTLREGPQEAREGQKGCWCPVLNPRTMRTLRAVLHLATQTSEMRASHGILVNVLSLKNDVVRMNKILLF